MPSTQPWLLQSSPWEMEKSHLVDSLPLVVITGASGTWAHCIGQSPIALLADGGKGIP